MKLYKYKSLQNLWHILDIVINRRLYCAHWAELNDPLEGRYEAHFSDKGALGKIERAKNAFRVASLSASPDNFLLWSHYADGHKGVAIELDLPENHPDIVKVIYSPFSSVFSEEPQKGEDMRHIFNGKSEEWSYEQEYRIIFPRKYFRLPLKISRILVGPIVKAEQIRILRAALPLHVTLVQTELDRIQGVVRAASEG
ncbi:hypothetical protein CBP36_06450 [Acidovorax carolinensis]|uniref:DUF2971 domain-containing protein n=1 Tax=Acidovorax carolinensis TaxID=553814 RepID=A0A240UBQ6_9BURK|nr:DUF2971 domain-containing protein [Acidovorax carolinensis]ART55602.1 hypothetical protein CBP35_12490 [Acidovorax carolinensis]ART58546.1 hypothetical protein CBP36_06450 [Acidovorax carolinensis]